MHNGDWDPHPGAITQFLKKLGATTMSNVQYNRISVHLTKDDLTNHPFIYMTGHTDFQFSQTDAAKLTKYLYNGGFLLVNCCCGSSEFDLAFRRELKKIFPNNDLTELPPTHPVFNSFYTIDQVEYTQKASQSRAGNKEPYLEGIMAKDYAMVLYSKYGMAWDQQIRPYTKTYQPEDSIKLGINSIVYALSH